MADTQCHFCGAAVRVREVVPRDSTCDSCRRDLRCCVNCRHYDTRYNNSCVEPMAEPVEYKDRRNFCEYFSFSREPFVASKQETRSSEARARLDALFGGKRTAPERPSEARAKLEALFGKKSNGEKRDRD